MNSDFKKLEQALAKNSTLQNRDIKEALPKPKILRSFTLDNEVVELMDDERNKSGLINKLLRNHYGV